MAAPGNRNVVCSVAFVEIADYAKQSVEAQMRLKERFNALLEKALVGVPAGERIVLDADSGVAISFLGDPDHGLFFALALRDALRSRADDELALHVGINLGPVRLITNASGDPNIIGDGIAVAQRIMSFADSNQFLASRSYYESIAALSADYARLFTFEGARTDLHVRDHDVYALGDAAAPARVARRASAHRVPLARKLTRAANGALVQIMRRPPLATALAVALILLTAVALRVALHGAEPGASADATADATTQPAQPQPAPGPAQQTEPATDVRTAAKSKPARAPQPQTRLGEHSAATGTVRLSILPWGEVYVDGEKFGVAPPLRDIALKQGRHKVEVRNPGFASYVQVVDVRAGEETRIRHRFQ